MQSGYRRSVLKRKVVVIMYVRQGLWLGVNFCLIVLFRSGISIKEMSKFTYLKKRKNETFR